MKNRLAKGEQITLHAVVKAGQHPGNYEVVTATIPGADPKLKDEEIAFSCHLDHQRPGANDNASGCATILEVARTLQKLAEKSVSGACTKSEIEPLPGQSQKDKQLREWLSNDCNFLIGSGQLQRPGRTIRFIFPPEIEGTMALLNSKPEFAKRIKTVIHMDMAGGGPETKAVFHVTRGPMSLPSFVHDVAWAFADWINDESYKFAATGDAKYPMIAPGGGKEPLRAEYSAYTMGSDHDVYQDSSFGIPTIYLNDWPDRYIHTNLDSAANIDPTKLKRAAFIGAASGYFLARTSTDELIPEAWKAVRQGRTVRSALELSRANSLDRSEQLIQEAGVCSYELGFDIGVDEETAKSVATSHCPSFYTSQAPFPTKESVKKLGASPQGQIFKRKEVPKGPLAVFGYDYFADHAKAAGVATPKLLSYKGLWGGGEEYAYEVLNFANGERDTQQIRDAVSAEYGPVPFEMVAEYLAALEKIGVLEKIK
jgi:aminopeptidase YwaD